MTEEEYTEFREKIISQMNTMSIEEEYKVYMQSIEYHNRLLDALRAPPRFICGDDYEDRTIVNALLFIIICLVITLVLVVFK